MKKNIVFERRSLRLTINFLLVFLISMVLISSSTLSLQLFYESKNSNNPLEKKDVLISNGLAPKSQHHLESANKKIKNIEQNSVSSLDCYTMFGYKANPAPEELVCFDICDPETIDVLGDTISGDFLSGCTFGCDGIWYGVQYSNGVLYGIDPYSFDMWCIGGGGENMNSLAWSPCYNKLYGGGDDNCLYEIDPDTGDQEMIGAFGNDVDCMIGMSFDAFCVLYGWDLGCDKLWTIDTESGEATEVGPLGIDLNYAQDGEFHRESDVLYLTAYTNTGQLYDCDKETGQCTLISDFEDGAQITGSIFDQYCWFPRPDIALREINYPKTGPVTPNMKMQITVKNQGNNTETFDAQMEIIKNQEGAGSILLDENFSGTFPPEGWETDYWSQCNLNCSPEPPCACAYREDHVQNYDNYISSKPINASNYKMCKLRFYFKADLYYPQYCNFYVKYRKNENSSWKDISPWVNPLNQNFEGQFYELMITDYDEDCGDALEIKWEYIGYYYYFKSFVLDSVAIEGCDYYYEYAELVEDITLKPSEEAQIEFPDWTPSQWQNPEYENSWEDYFVNAFVIAWGDLYPKNNKKNKWIDLYFGYFDDVGCNNITGPENGPAQTFPVTSQVKNFGQFPESNFSINISIGEISISETLLDESSWSSVPPNEWTDEHKSINESYGWKKSDTSYSGGSSPEAYIPYNYCKANNVFYSYAIDTSAYDILKLRFKSYINHYSGQGFYSLEAGYSTDKETWHAVWHEEPGSNKNYDVDVPINESSETMYIGFWVKGNPYYFSYWYIDDIKLVDLDLNEEYSNDIFYEDDISPGEEITFDFDDWTPEFLEEEVSGQKDYLLKSWTDLQTPNDKNHNNDLYKKIITLDYFHDVGIEEITSPTGDHPDRIEGDLIYDNGEPDGVYGLFFGYYGGYDNWLIDDFEITQKTDITGIKFHFVWNAGYSSNCENVKICIVEETGTCNPDSGPAYYEYETTDFVEYATGNVYFSRPEVVIEADFEGVTVPAGKYWIGVCPDGIFDNSAYWLTAPLKNCCIQFDSPYLGYSRWTAGSDIGYNYDLAWAIYGEGRIPPIKAWIQPGSEDIKSVVKNYGTFPEDNLYCYAEIKEYITDPENGTEVWTGEVGNIELLPLGGYEDIDFGSFTFEDEGRYGLFMQLPADLDDFDKNNEMKYGIAVDNTVPYCDYPPILDPPEPTGLNGWYVDDVTVTLNATDPWSNDVSSGVKEIRFTINGGTEQVIDGKTGSFVLTEDGDDILVEYWAIDNVGNVETPKNSFTIDIDQTVPDISLSYEIAGGNKWQGWNFEFTAIANDDMSGMDRVEFYLNDLIQKTIEGPGPEYIWKIRYNPLPKAIFKAIAYDKAGNYFSDEIWDPTKNTHIHSITFQIFNILKKYRGVDLSFLYDNFPVFKEIFRRF